MNNFFTILIFALILCAVDKGVTAMNIHYAGVNNWEPNPYAVEKNPLARWFFENAGLLWGSILYFLISVVSFIFAVWLLSITLGIFFPLNKAELYATMFMAAVYLVVIGNNLHWLYIWSQPAPVTLNGVVVQ
jgi:hypothetical protein